MITARTATRRAFIAATLASALVAATGPAFPDTDAPMLTVTGELTYLQRIALPEGSVAVVLVRPADAPGDQPSGAEARIPLEGRQVPVAFSLDVPRAGPQAGNNLVLYGAIVAGGVARFLSNPVTIDASGETLDLGTVILEPFTSPVAPFGLAGNSGLENIEWRVTEISGERVAEGSEPTIRFGADRAFSGRTCNSFGGAYRLDGQSLSFDPNIVATMMACPEPLGGIERALFDALPEVKSHTLEEDGTLVLSDGDGNALVVARR